LNAILNRVLLASKLLFDPSGNFSPNCRGKNKNRS